MSTDAPAERRRSFFDVATDLGLLSPETARDLSAESTDANVPVSQLVVEKGLLDAVDVDIVVTLQRAETIIPGYEILDVLGRGGMGVVYRARQQTLDRIVALKTVLVSQMADRSVIQRFEQEAKTVGKLRHPNIVAAYDFGRHEGRLYFVMEYVEGNDAQKLIDARGRLDEATAWGLARQAAAGLAHAAELGVVHRDIKPANLLLVDPPAGFSLPSGLPMVKIADFGLALLTSESDARTRVTSANMAVGSPNYTAPEQLQGSTVDQRSDIYALGASVFHMLAGRAPFDAANLTQLVAQKLAGETPSIRPFRPDVAEVSVQLLAEMMAREPEQRLSDYGQLLQRIDALPAEITESQLSKTQTLPAAKDSSQTVTAALTTTVSLRRPGAISRRWKLAAVPAACLLVVAIVGGVAWSLRMGQPDIVPAADLLASGWSEPLFDGQSLRGWVVVEGEWLPGKDDEGARVLAGTDGLIRRPLFRPGEPDPVPLEHFRLTMLLQTNLARDVETRFGIVPAEDGSSGGYLAIRFSEDQVSLLKYSGDETQEVAVTRQATGTADRRRGLRIERHSAGWLVYVDDELLGTVVKETMPILPEYRLHVEGGPVWISDVWVEELIKK